MKTSIVILGLMLLLPGSWAAAQQSSEPISVHIQAQPMQQALDEFARQTGLQVVFATEDVARGMAAPKVSGSYAPKVALDMLLADSGLRYEFINPKTIAIKSAKAGSSEPVAVTQARVSTLLLAQENTLQQVAQAENKPASATQTSGTRIEEIVVSAQKRLERLQDVPISISVLSGEELDKSTAEGITEVLNRVPGVAASVAMQGGGTQLAVRGVSASNPLFSGSSAIAYYLDGVPLGLVHTAIVPDANVYDMERVEVLRGPQGTLYGSSALNGVVRVLTRDANLNELEFKVRGSVSGTEYSDGENYRADMAVNVPLVPGKLAARAVLGYEDFSGWLDKTSKKDANDSQLRNARLKLNAQPTERLSIGLSAWLSRGDKGALSTSPDNRISPRPSNEPFKSDYDVYGLKVGYDFSAFSLSSVTSRLNYLSDSFFGAQKTIMDAKTLSQEVNLTSTRPGLWRWTLGGIYRDGEDRLFADVPGVLVAPLDQNYRSKSFAAFGELTRTFLDGKLDLTGGLRYFEDSLTEREDSRLTGAVPLRVYSRKTFDNVSPRLILTGHPNDRSTLYVSYSEGFRSGSAQPPTVLAVVPAFRPVEPDKLKNYEVGAKGSLWGGHVNFDTALFYIDWQDVQQSLLVPVSPTLAFTTVINSESASGMGFEFATTVEPADGLTFGANFSWNDLQLDADVLSGNQVLFVKGGRLNFSPEYTMGASADYAFNLGGSGHEGRLAASFNYTSKQQSRRLLGPNVFVSAGEPMAIGRVSFSIDSPNRWTATLFVDNVNNEQAAVLSDWLGDLNSDLRIRPRTVGVQFEYRN